jgi:hypothetical protein
MKRVRWFVLVAGLLLLLTRCLVQNSREEYWSLRHSSWNWRFANLTSSCQNARIAYTIGKWAGPPWR